MTVIKQNVSRKLLVNGNVVKDERLNNGQSITKAIVMGGRGCCGGAYVERAQLIYLIFNTKGAALISGSFLFLNFS